MNILGVEQRSAYAVFALREGQHPPRIVGDGRRSLVPIAACGELWASEAASQPAAGWNGWTDSANHTEFWQGLQRRMARFLGGETTAAHDLRLALATSRSHDETAACAARAGLATACVISPPEAALAAWLSRQRSSPANELMVAVATVGDLSAEANAFHVQTGSDPAILRTGCGEVCFETGVGYFAQQLIQQVTEHLPAGEAAGNPVEAWQAALEMGERLRRATRGTDVPWSGPWEEQLLSPATFSAESFLQSDAALRLTHWLHVVLPKLVQQLGTKRPDVLLLSGAGADWPLAADVWAGLPAPLAPANPSYDIALGASYWPHLEHSQASIQTGSPARLTSSVAPSFVSFSAIAPPAEPREGSSAASPPGLRHEEFARLLSEQLDELSEES